MKKLLLVTVALLATLTTFAQNNLTSGKTVYPLGGLKSFLPEGVVTEDNLQKITQDGNTSNVFRRRVSVLSSQHGKVPTVVPTSM